MIGGAEAVASLARLIRDASAMLVFTGAGISTASGIPDYRGPSGVWKTRQPVYYADFMSNHEARVHYWQQKLEDREAFGAARPNDVHAAVAHLDAAGRLLLLVTQNIDGLDTDAGTARERLVEVHGTNRLVECQSCTARTDPAPHFAAFRATGEPPVCECGGFLKPATISFGQQLRSEDIGGAFAAAEACDLVVALGSTLSVTPAANVPIVAADRGVPYAIVNRGPTEHAGRPFVTLRVEGDVSAMFPPAVEAALGTGTG
jgi:NAD-dependent deacetylase